ncbi:hypothetical protein IHE45_04G114900 [Dioscorea alata]|uniref:Uncharacterized protein n=1 Tax=Dioscorea alata TaxID=55571 RepID=A0ACB7WFL1_DIOAL|nr:hypothetical protein IHE45_04G114900 [Dioscorea alata]
MGEIRKGEMKIKELKLMNVFFKEARKPAGQTCQLSRWSEPDLGHGNVTRNALGLSGQPALPVRTAGQASFGSALGRTRPAGLGQPGTVI